MIKRRFLIFFYLPHALIWEEIYRQEEGAKANKKNFYFKIRFILADRTTIVDMSIAPSNNNTHSRNAVNRMFRRNIPEERVEGRNWQARCGISDVDSQYLRYCSKAQNTWRARYLTTLTAISCGDPVVCDITSRLTRRATNPFGCDSRRSAYDCKT